MVISTWLFVSNTLYWALFGTFISSPGPKGHVSFCHHFASVVVICFHRLSSFWQEDFQSFNQSEHIGPGSHVGFLICTKITNLVEDLPMNISPKFGPNLFSGFREVDEHMKSLQTQMTTMVISTWLFVSNTLYWALFGTFISSPGPKGHVSFCHHFASVVVICVCKLFICSSTSLKPLNRFGPNLGEIKKVFEWNSHWVQW
jgi:hypothetical protein